MNKLIFTFLMIFSFSAFSMKKTTAPRFTEDFTEGWKLLLEDAEKRYGKLPTSIQQIEQNKKTCESSAQKEYIKCLLNPMKWGQCSSSKQDDLQTCEKAANTERLHLQAAEKLLKNLNRQYALQAELENSLALCVDSYIQPK